jgi:ferredoxin
MAFRKLAEPDAASPKNRHVPAATCLPLRKDADALYPYFPAIDDRHCTACDACSRICPTDAISLNTNQENRSAYEIAPWLCSGCSLCTDVCESNAVTLEFWQRGRPQTVELDKAQCKSCGNVYSQTTARSSSEEKCRICLQADHNGKLFQVLR